MVTRLLIGAFLVAAMACGGGKSPPATETTAVEPAEPADTTGAPPLDEDGLCCCLAPNHAAGEPDVIGAMPPARCSGEDSYCGELGYCE